MAISCSLPIPEVESLKKNDSVQFPSKIYKMGGKKTDNMKLRDNQSSMSCHVMGLGYYYVV